MLYKHLLFAEWDLSDEKSLFGGVPIKWICPLKIISDTQEKYKNHILPSLALCLSLLSPHSLHINTNENLTDFALQLPYVALEQC